jgi:hypothetical protein
MPLAKMTIGEFIKYVNQWNTEQALGLTFHGEHNGHAAWSVGNLLITGIDAAPDRVLFEPDNFDLRGTDGDAREVYQTLLGLIQAHFGIDDTPQANRFHKVAFRQIERMARAWSVAPGDVPETETEFRARMREQHSDITEKELDELWQSLCRLVEQEKARSEEQERRLTMTAEEAAQEWLAQFRGIEPDESGAGESIILSEIFPGTLVHFRELVERLWRRNRGGWTAGNGERLEWSDRSPEKSEPVGVKNISPRLPAGATPRTFTNRVVYRTVKHLTRGEWGVWVYSPDGELDKKRLSYIIASERYDGQSEIDFHDGCDALGKEPIGPAFAEFAQMVVSGWSVETTPADDGAVGVSTTTAPMTVQEIDPIIRAVSRKLRKTYTFQRQEVGASVEYTIYRGDIELGQITLAPGTRVVPDARIGFYKSFDMREKPDLNREWHMLCKRVKDRIEFMHGIGDFAHVRERLQRAQMPADSDAGDQEYRAE